MKSTKTSLFFEKTMMAASLFLLASGLVFFLRKSWLDEKMALEKEVGYLFVTAVRGIEGGILDELLKKNAGGERFDFGLPKMSSDSVKVMAFSFKKDSFKTVEKTEKTIIRIEQNETTEGSPTDLRGSISMVVAHEGGHSERLDSLDFQLKNGHFEADLAEKFEKAVAQSGLPVRLRIVESRADSIEKTPFSWRAGSYTDLASGQKFEAEISEARPFLLRKIWPEILFSLLLFGCSAAAFGLIFKNLKAQKRLREQQAALFQNISHELKTPISTVSVALEALRDFDVLRRPEQALEYLEMSKNELTRLSLLVEKTLTTARLGDQKMPMARAVFDFEKMVSEAVAALGLPIEMAGATVIFKAGKGDFEVLGDRLHLGGVVFNLIDNALKYCPRPAEIRLFLTEIDEKTISLAVADNGRGIPRDLQKKVFERFFRVPTGAVHDVKGHGLGLAYAAEVAEAHSGRIDLESSPSGSIFTLILKKR